jgi:hypothetical protein
VASGVNGSQILFDAQNAQYLKVEQTGTSTNQWRIAEFYLINSGTPPTTRLKEIKQSSDMQLWYENGQINLSGLTGSSRIRLFDISGKTVLPPVSIKSSIHLNLKTGVYITLVENNGQVFRKKLIIKQD